MPALEHGPLAEDRAGSDLGDGLAVDLDRQHAVEQEEQLVARLALLDEALALLELADLGLSPPRMIVADSWRSSAVSTAVTSACESSSPHGVCLPNASRYQSLKSASPPWPRACPSAS